MPVRLTVPTMMPATAVATAMPSILRPPSSRLLYRSEKPWRTVPARGCERNQAINGRCVISMKPRKLQA